MRRKNATASLQVLIITQAQLNAQFGKLGAGIARWVDHSKVAWLLMTFLGV